MSTTASPHDRIGVSDPRGLVSELPNLIGEADLAGEVPNNRGLRHERTPTAGALQPAFPGEIAERPPNGDEAALIPGRELAFARKPVARLPFVRSQSGGSQSERLAVEAVGEGRWALEAAIGEARARAAGRAGVRPGIALTMPDVRGLRSLAETEPRVVPAELVVVVVEGAYIQELTVASIAAPPARLPRGPFVKGYG
jgi:hypothetical protein